MDNTLNETDPVATEEGDGIVAGFLDGGEIEVRYPSQGRRLKIWPRDAVTKIEGQPNGTVMETTVTEPLVEVATTDDYRQARAQGLSPAVAAGTFDEEGLIDKPPVKQSTLAQLVASGNNAPRDKNGRPLSGAALAKARAKQQREGS